MRIILAVLTLACLVMPLTLVAEEGGEAHLSESYGLRILHAWTNATEGPMAFVYAEIENEGDTDRILLGAEGKGMASATLTGFAFDGDTTTEIALPELRIAPASHLDLSPGEVAIRLNGLVTPLVEGNHLILTLVFDAGKIEVEVAVEDEGATAHSHAGHAH